MKNKRLLATIMVAGVLGACAPTKKDSSAAPAPASLAVDTVCTETLQQTEKQFADDALVCKGRPETRDLENMVASCRGLKSLLAGSSCTLPDGRALAFDEERSRRCLDAATELEKRRQPIERPPRPPERRPGKTPEPPRGPVKELTDLSKLDRIQRVQFRVTDAESLRDVLSNQALPSRALIKGRVFESDEVLFALLRGKVACALYSNETPSKIENGERLVSVGIQGPDKIGDIEASRLSIALQRRDGGLLLLSCYGKHDPTPGQVAESLQGALQTLSAE